MSHPNAALTRRHRLAVARLVVDEDWPIREVAARFQVSWPAVKHWAERYRAGQSMQDRSSRPRHSPNKTDAKTTKRFHRTLADGWAYARCYTSEAERRAELEGWLHYSNHHRPHTACGNQPPFSRLINVPGQYS